MQGWSLKTVLIAFVEVRQFRALGNESCPMCRAITKALVGTSLDAVTMSFEDLLIRYAPREEQEFEAE